MTRQAIHLSTTDVARAIGGDLVGPDQAVFGVSTDSRNLASGDLFVALRGPRFDGHDYVVAALERGAAAVLVERVPPGFGGAAVVVSDTLVALGALGRWWRRARGLPVLGLTGSNGKTTTKELAASLLAAHVRVHRTQGNLNNRIGVPMTLLGISDRHQVAVIEMGMNQRGEIADLTAMCEPDVALLLNVGPAHIGELGSLEAIAEAKAEMLHHAPATAKLVVNADDPRVMEHASRFDPGRLRRFGESPEADVRLVARRPSDRGQQLELSIDGAPCSVELGLVGRHAAANATAALAAVTALPAPVRPPAGLAFDAWREVSPVSGRFCVRTVGDVRLVDDAYNANPASLSSSLAALLEIRAGAPFGVVLGEMNELGSFSESAHRDAGLEIANAGASFLATLGPGARPATEAARAAGVASFHTDEDVDSLWDFVRERLAPGAWLLLKGSRRARLERVAALLEAR